MTVQSEVEMANPKSRNIFIGVELDDDMAILLNPLRGDLYNGLTFDKATFSELTVEKLKKKVWNLIHQLKDQYIRSIRNETDAHFERLRAIGIVWESFKSDLGWI